jgi:outer membrane protein TolC
MTMLWLGMIQNRSLRQINLNYTELLRSREDIVYTRMEAGVQRAGTSIDIYRIGIRSAELENEIRKMDDEFEAMLYSFNRLAGRESDARVELPESLPELQQQNITLPGLVLNPDYNMAVNEALAAETMQDVMRLETRPMLGVGLQYSWFAPGKMAGQMDGGHMIIPMFSATLPVFTRKNQAIRRQAQLNYEAALLRSEDVHNTLMIRWQQLQSEARRLGLDDAFYNRQLEVTQQIRDILMSGYSAGDDRFEELLEIENQLLELEERKLRTRISRYINLTGMEMLAGRGVFE